MNSIDDDTIDTAHIPEHYLEVANHLMTKSGVSYSATDRCLLKALLALDLFREDSTMSEETVTFLLGIKKPVAFWWLENYLYNIAAPDHRERLLKPGMSKPGDPPSDAEPMSSNAEPSDVNDVETSESDVEPSDVSDVDIGTILYSSLKGENPIVPISTSLTSPAVTRAVDPDRWVSRPEASEASKPRQVDPYLGALDPDRWLTSQFQVWHNPPKRGRSVWSIKIESAASPVELIDREPMSGHSLRFIATPRRFRDELRKWVKKGKLAEADAEEVGRRTDNLLPDMKVALLTQDMHDKFVTIETGESTRDQRYFPAYLATLMVEDDEPKELTCWFPIGYEPIVITKFWPTGNTTPNSPKWTASYDPTHIYADTKQIERAQAHKRDETKRLIAHSSVTALERTIKILREPMEGDMDMAFDLIRELKKSVAALLAENERLNRDVLSLAGENYHIRASVAALEDKFASFTSGRHQA